jgi:endo-1,4-beta-xylanase
MSGSGGCITPYGVGAAFKATWNNSGDFLARIGFQWNSSQTYDQLGTISADYAETKTGSGGGYSFIGIYGWSQNPLREYYIVDDWFGGHPNPGTKVGTITVDGGTYDVIKNTRVNQPSIEGTSTFDQFFSIRQTARQCGHISISDHWAQWAKMGLQLGKMYEAKILVEAGGGSGTVDFTSATLVDK